MAHSNNWSLKITDTILNKEMQEGHQELKLIYPEQHAFKNFYRKTILIILINPLFSLG